MIAFRSYIYLPILEIDSFETMQPGSRRVQIISVRRTRAYTDNEFTSVDYVMRMDNSHVSHVHKSAYLLTD